LTGSRHYYFSERWQVLEERTGEKTAADSQFAWGARYVDDLVLRDRDAAGTGSLSERIYALQDSNWNVTAVVDLLGNIVERYVYSGYGMPLFLTSEYAVQSASTVAWETLYGAYRWDAESALYYVRRRSYAPNLGAWVQRDPLGFTAGVNLYQYAVGNPINHTDPSGAIIFLVVAALAIGVAAGVVTYAYTGNASQAVAVGASVFVLALVIILGAGIAAGMLTGQAVIQGGGAGALAGTISFSISAANATATGLVVGATVCLAVGAIANTSGLCIGSSTCADFGCRQLMGPGYSCQPISGKCYCRSSLPTPPDPTVPDWAANVQPLLAG
jgi:RHS repeat-associated protein